MKISLEDPSQLMSHLLLEDEEVAAATAKTRTKDDSSITATVQFNGVEMKPETLERVLKHFCWCVENDLMKKYADVEAEVHRRLLERVQKEADELTAVMHDFTQRIEDANALIKPYWEK